MKPRPLRFFIIASGFVILCALALILYSYEKSATENLFKLAERQAVTLASVIANDMRANAPEHLAAYRSHLDEKHDHADHTRQLEKTLVRLLKDLPVLKVEIFIADRVYYAPKHEEIGRTKSGGKFAQSNTTGSPASELFVAGDDGEFDASVHGRYVMETYVPFGPLNLDDPNSPRLTVELYADVTTLAQRVSDTKFGLMITLFVTFGVLYGVLILIVNRANHHVHRQSSLIHLLSRTSDDANMATSWQEATQRIIDRLCDHTGWPVGHAFTLSEGSTDKIVSSGIWHIQDSSRFAPFRKMTENSVFTPGVGLPGLVLASGKPAWITDIRNDPNLPRADTALRCGIRSGFACPVMVGDRIVAVLEFFATEIVPSDAALLDTLVQIGIQLGRVVEREKASAEIRENENRFRDVASAASDWFYEMDAEGRFRYFSERFTETTGIPAERLLGKTWQESGVDKEFIADIRPEDAADYFARRPFRNFNYSRKLPEGGEQWVSISGVPYYAADGAFAGFRGTGTDVTVVKRQEIALRTNEERFRAFIDNSPSAILIKDTDGRYLSANRRWHDWFNPQQKEIAGKTVYDFYDREHAERIAALDRKIAETGEPVESELDTVFADGSVHATIMQKFPIFDENGEVSAIGGAHFDITAQRNAEDQLRQSQKMEAVGQLTGGIAHDFNNLLNVIIGNLDFLSEDLAENSQYSKLIEAATKAAMNCASLNRQLLAFSRKQSLDPKVIDLNAQVESLQAILARALGEAVDIQTVKQAGLWTCKADPAQVESALLNLAINARDAMPDGGTLRIETANTVLDENTAPAETAPGEYVSLSVSDTGTGMSPDILAHVFEPFFTTKAVGKGSGLGLSMVFGFAKQSNGAVTVTSVEGEGTTVTLHLPRAHSEASEVRETLQETPEAKGERILVVEDDDDLLALVSTLLHDLGYDVLAARSGPEALSVIEETTDIQLLLTDIVLPGGLDGVDLADQIRARLKGIKVLFMSGYTRDAMKRQDRLDDNILLLQKPFRKSELAVNLRQALVAEG